MTKMKLIFAFACSLLFALGTTYAKKMPVLDSVYGKENGKWVLTESDSLKYDNKGQLLEKKGLMSGVLETWKYDAFGNTIEYIQKGKESSEKKVYGYDPIVTDYQVSRITYYEQPEKGWIEDYQHFKKIERVDNKIISIKIYTVREKDTALNSSYGMEYGADGRATTFYDIENFEGAKDTNLIYKDMVWEAWKGQLTDEDFLEDNKLKSATVLVREADEPVPNKKDIKKEPNMFFYEAEFYENGYDVTKNAPGQGFDFYRIERTDTNGSFFEEGGTATISGSDTTLEEAFRYEEFYDAHKNLVDTKNSSSDPEVGPEPILREHLGHHYIYGSDGSILQHTMLEYNVEEPQRNADSVERIVYFFKGTTGRELALGSASFGLYPNPASHWVKISTTGDFNKVSIYDLGGRLIREEAYGLNKAVNVANLEEGTYVIRLSGSEGVATRKFVKINR